MAAWDDDFTTDGTSHQPDPNERVIRNLNGIKITCTYRGKRLPPIYEVWREGLVIGSNRHLDIALHYARENIPRKPRIITREVLAIRGWNLRADMLVPLTRGDDLETWTGPVASAHSLEREAGLYCVKPHPEAVGEMIRAYTPEAYGIVAVLGRAIEYERGYRAMRVVIRHLVIRLAGVSDGYLSLLSDRYQCDVVREKKHMK